MKRLIVVGLSLLIIGCGSGGGTASNDVVPSTTSTVVKADSAPPGPPESPSFRDFEAAGNTTPPPPPGPTPAGSPQSYSMDLVPGWNPIAFECTRVLSIEKPPEVRGICFFDGSTYPTRPLDPDSTNNEDEGPRRGLYAFATGACTLRYTGVDDNRGDFVKLRRGWNMVSFATATRIDSRNLNALVLTPEGPQPVPVASVVLPQFFRLERNGGQLQIDIVTGAELEPGRCYWVYAERECALVWGRPPVLPTPSPRPEPSPTVRPSPRPEPSPSVRPSPRPEPSPSVRPSPEASPI